MLEFGVCRWRNTIRDDTSSLVNLNIGLGEMNSSVAECDDRDSRVGVEFIQERELLVTDNAGRLLRPVLESHVQEKVFPHVEIAPGNA